MTHAAFEQSRDAATPTELIEIRYGDDPADIVRLTSADHDLTIGGELYSSVTLQRDDVDEDGNPDDERQMNIELPYDSPFADVYRLHEFVSDVSVIIRATDLDDPDQQVIAIWSGRLTGVAWEYPWMVLGCERVSTSLKRTGLTARYQRMCRHVLYQPGCWLNRDNFLVPGTVDLIANGRQITIPEAGGFADGHFLGGILDFGGVLRHIVSHVGDLVVLNRALPGLAETDSVSLYPGCDRLVATCHSKFNNRNNYGGFDFQPPTGPFDGNSIV